MPTDANGNELKPGMGVFRLAGNPAEQIENETFVQNVRTEFPYIDPKEGVLVSAGFGIFDEEVPRGSIYAKTRVLKPRGKQTGDPREIWINHGAGGIGDALLGLCAVAGFKRAHPDNYVVYRVHENAILYCGMFDGAADHLALHVWDKVVNDFPPETDARDLQINLGYQQELTGRAQITRIERYCRNLGYVTPVMPTLRDPDAIRKEARTWTERIVLSPFGAALDRTYPLRGWLTIERELIKAGYNCVVLGTRFSPKCHGMEFPNRTDLFQSQVVTDPPPKMLAGMILTSKLVIGNDSAAVHIAGMLGRPAIALCGWSVGDKIFSFYPTVRSLQGVLACNGCWTKGPDFDHVRCMLSCDNLASIDPMRVVREVLTRVARPRETEG